MSAAAPLRFITIRFSHFCEKARWALDRAGVAYREESHVPILSWRATLGAGGKRTVPCLVTPGRVVDDSTEILRWADAQGGAAPLFPAGEEAAEVEALEAEFDRRLGPAARRVAYFHLLQRPALMRGFLASAGTGWEARAGALLFPLLRAMVVRGLRIDPVTVARSRAALDEAFATVEARLADGRRYLVGGRFSAADLSFAALAAPVLVPEALRQDYPPIEAVPPEFTALVEHYRARPAGRFALRLYDEERGARRGL